MAFKKKKKETPAVSTASLPDIVFMLLFFFMVATVLRENPVLVKNKLPQATEMTKIQDKDVVSYIYIGQPLDERFGTADKVQLNDKFMRDLSDIGKFVEAERGKLPAFKQDMFTVSLKIDSEAKTGMKFDITEELRKVHALKVNYATLPRGEVY